MIFANWICCSQMSEDKKDELNKMGGKKPLKAKNLKIIDHKGTLYATFDGVNYWKLEKYIYNLLKVCDGKRSFEEIVQNIAEKSGLSKEKIKVALRPIFGEFERDGFITYV